MRVYCSPMTLAATLELPWALCSCSDVRDQSVQAELAACCLIGHKPTPWLTLSLLASSEECCSVWGSALQTFKSLTLCTLNFCLHSSVWKRNIPCHIPCQCAIFICILSACTAQRPCSPLTPSVPAVFLSWVEHINAKTVLSSEENWLGISAWAPHSDWHCSRLCGCLCFQLCWCGEVVAARRFSGTHIPFEVRVFSVQA